MDAYEHHALHELRRWQHKVSRKPSIASKLSRKLQQRINRAIPEKVHQAITTAIRQMIRAVLFGSGITTSKMLLDGSLKEREQLVLERVQFYKKTAAVEGGVTGAGGLLLGLADFPLLLGLKMKMLFEIAALYGHDVNDVRERLYILQIFQLAFSNQQHRREIYAQIADWQAQYHNLPKNFDDFNWRTFQQEYRDYIDLAKLAQLIPVIGAAVGFVVNYKLVNQLGEASMNAYRLRWFSRQPSTK
ncbi:MAG TPA: EcsC family protein [Chitinophagaceae bacterium]|nr:EcsC family protein [Chitinophagaceae bacterium]